MQPVTFHPISTVSQGDVNGAQNTYNSDIAASQAANQNLASYRSQMTDPSQMYKQNVQETQNQYGVDPAQLLKANQALAATQTTMANLPQAIREQGNYYGTTAGAEANNYQQQAGNLQGVLAGQGNAVNAYQASLDKALNQAGTQTQFGVQGQQMNLQTLQGIYENSYKQQQTAQTQLQNLQGLFQQQGQFNASQAAEYAKANAALQSANAAMVNAQATASRYASQTALDQQQYAYNQSQSQMAQQQHTQQAAQQQAAQAAAIRNYTPSGAPLNYTQLAKTGSPLDAIGHFMGAALTGSF